MHTSSNEGDNGLYHYDSFTGTTSKPKSSFLWWCAGAHTEKLRAFPSEHSKYAGLGGVLLATFVLAALSAGYTFYTIFNSWEWSLLFAIIWGLIIFNFDRFLVSTIRKYGVSKSKQWSMVIPRIVLALLIGFTIARPLELKLFEKEIEGQMKYNQHEKIRINDSLLQQEFALQYQTALSDKEKLITQQRAIEDSLYQLQQAYIREADGTGGSGQRGIEALTLLKQQAYVQTVAAKQPELASIRAAIQTKDSILTNNRSSLESKRKAFETSLANTNGFLERNKALSDLSEKESSVFYSVLLISLLIIIIETAPIISKMIMPVGPYDLAIAKEELIAMAEEQDAMRFDNESRSGLREHFKMNQKQNREELLKQMNQLQKKYIDEELDKWERGEWNPKDHRPSMDEVMRKIKERYTIDERNIL